MSESEPLVSIAAAARAVGISRQTLHEQVKLRAVRSHGGKVRVSEVRRDRAANIDRTKRPFTGPAGRRTAPRSANR